MADRWPSTPTEDHLMDWSQVDSLLATVSVAETARLTGIDVKRVAGRKGRLRCVELGSRPQLEPYERALAVLETVETTEITRRLVLGTLIGMPGCRQELERQAWQRATTRMRTPRIL